MPFFALIKKEIYRFSSVWAQTIGGPLATALLYQLIFGNQLSSIKTGMPGVDYATFLIPGLVIMQVLLNSFGNSSSSLMQSKYTGNLIFILMAPISPISLYCAYLVSSILRGVVVGAAVFAGIVWFGTFKVEHVWAVLYFVVFGSAITGGLGIIGGILSEKWDHIAGFQSFVMTPLIYLSGIFFNIQNFGSLWKSLAMLDPFLYIVDGFRYGFIGHASFNISQGVLFVFAFTIIINGIGFGLVKYGIKLKH